MDDKIEILEEICNKYLEERAKIIEKNWLNIKALSARLVVNTSLKHPITYQKTRRADFEFTSRFLTWLKKYAEEKEITPEVLNKFNIYLRNHQIKLFSRLQFLYLFAGILIIINSTMRLISEPIAAYCILFVFGFLALNERAFLVDKKSGINELINMLEILIEEMDP